MIRRTIREWERIGYGTDETTILEAEADRIVAVAQTAEVAKVRWSMGARGCARVVLSV